MRQPARVGTAAAIGAATLLSCACGTEQPTPPATDRAPFQLADAERWLPVDPADDPFDDRPPDDICGPGGFVVEGETLEVNTIICPYFTGRQPTLERIVAGDQVDVVAWHLTLLPPPTSTTAVAHLAFRIGDVTLLDETIDIPSTEQVYSSTWIADRDIAVGTPLSFHVHNHGYNSYKLGRVVVTPRKAQ